jgi:hypothetical protein
VVEPLTGLQGLDFKPYYRLNKLINNKKKKHKDEKGREADT